MALCAVRPTSNADYRAIIGEWGKQWMGDDDTP